MYFLEHFCSISYYQRICCFSLPCFAFLFCIIYSWLNHYEWVTRTHCLVWNVAPSISGKFLVISSVPMSYGFIYLCKTHNSEGKGIEAIKFGMISQQIIQNVIIFYCSLHWKLCPTEVCLETVHRPPLRQYRLPGHLRGGWRHRRRGDRHHPTP